MSALISAATVVSARQYASVTEGTRLLTADRGVLSFYNLPNPEETLDVVCISVLAALSPHPENSTTHPERVRLLVTSAFTDSDGRLWQSTRVVNMYELWNQVTNAGRLFANAAKAEDIPPPALAGAPRPAVQVRTIIVGQDCCFDGRDNRLVAMTQRDRDGEYPVRALYELREKYFGVRFEVFEEARSFPGGDWRAPPELGLLIEIFVDGAPIAVVGKHNRLLPAEGHSLLKENPVRGYGLRLKLDPRLFPSFEPADPAAWRKALAELGQSPAEIDKALVPLPTIHYSKSN